MPGVGGGVGWGWVEDSCTGRLLCLAARPLCEPWGGLSVWWQQLRDPTAFAVLADLRLPALGWLLWVLTEACWEAGWRACGGEDGLEGCAP